MAPRKILSFLPLSLLICLALIPIPHPDSSAPERVAPLAAGPGMAEPSIAAPTDAPLKGPDVMIKFFADWHRPHGAVLPPEVATRIHEQIADVPREDTKDAEPWQLVGPSGMVTPVGSLYSGRILDLDMTSGGRARVAAASGGLWAYDVLYPSLQTANIPTQWLATFDVDPTDENTLLAGTGEFSIRAGAGVWKSVDDGVTWQQKTLDPDPSTCFRIRYGPFGQVVHLASENGYYRSTDGGETWERTLLLGLAENRVTDLAIHPWYDQVIYATLWGAGLVRSYDAGETWQLVDSPGLPTWGTLTRGALTISASDPAVMYVAFAFLNSNEKHVLHGIYRTGDFGATWQNVTPINQWFFFNYMNLQGWYNNVIAVCPTDADLVLAGGVELMRTEDGGENWQIVHDPHLHVDYHALQWHENGIDVWAGHDGGWSYSGDQGEQGTWISNQNYLPITQYYNIDAAGHVPGAWTVGGGSQDNGVSVSNDGGLTWNHVLGGDAGGFEIWPHTQTTMYATNGLFSDGLTWRRQASVDGGQTWTEHILGLDYCEAWTFRIRIGGDEYLYTNSCAQVYRGDPYNLVWTPLNDPPFNWIVRELTVSKDATQPVVYACLDSEDPAERLMVKSGTYWSERSTGLPVTHTVRKVVPHPTNNNVCYALMNGYTGGIHRSDYQGRTWTNIQGDLPDLPVADLIVDPYNDDILYLGTEYGCYRTLNGGTNWERWNYGLPEGAVVTEMRTLDLRELEGTYWIVAGTYGNSIWRRKISSYDPSAVPAAAARAALIRSVAPNPANPATTVAFELERAGRVTVDILDLSGRLVRRLLETELPEGPHDVTWDGTDVEGRAQASGMYLVKVASGGRYESRKLVVVR